MQAWAGQALRGEAVGGPAVPGPQLRRPPPGSYGLWPWLRPVAWVLPSVWLWYLPDLPRGFPGRPRELRGKKDMKAHLVRVHTPPSPCRPRVHIPRPQNRSVLATQPRFPARPLVQTCHRRLAGDSGGRTPVWRPDILGMGRLSKALLELSTQGRYLVMH